LRSSARARGRLAQTILEASQERSVSAKALRSEADKVSAGERILRVELHKKTVSGDGKLKFALAPKKGDIVSSSGSKKET